MKRPHIIGKVSRLILMPSYVKKFRSSLFAEQMLLEEILKCGAAAVST